MAQLPALDVSQDTLYTLLSLYLKTLVPQDTLYTLLSVCLKTLVRRWRSTGSSAEVVYRIYRPHTTVRIALV
jgi:hypothetical protein